MHEMIKEYIDKKNKAYEEKLNREMTAFLYEHDLYIKEYSPNDTYSSEYGYSEWDHESNRSKYYKKVPIAISKEDYEELLKAESLGVKKTTPTNSVASTLKVIAIIVYILGGIGSLILLDYSEVMFFVGLFSAFILGTMFLGFSEIIKLLHEINNKDS